MKIIIFLFYFFGIYQIINTNKNKQNINNYTVNDLIRGWGIYCLNIGMLLTNIVSSKTNINYIKFCLQFNFIISIIWHLFIVKRIGWTKHHCQSVFINLFILLLTL